MSVHDCLCELRRRCYKCEGPRETSSGACLSLGPRAGRLMNATLDDVSIRYPCPTQSILTLDASAVLGNSSGFAIRSDITLTTVGGAQTYTWTWTPGYSPGITGAAGYSVITQELVRWGPIDRTRWRTLVAGGLVANLNNAANPHKNGIALSGVPYVSHTAADLGVNSGVHLEWQGGRFPPDRAETWFRTAVLTNAGPGPLVTPVYAWAMFAESPSPIGEPISEIITDTPFPAANSPPYPL